MIKFNFILLKQHANHKNLNWRNEGKTEIKKNTTRKKHREKERQGSRGGSEGRKERERRREWGRREGEVLQLYPELQGSQEFHPWKSSLSFSLWKILQALSSSQLLFTHTHPLSHSLTYEDRHSILQSFAYSFLPHQNPSRPCAAPSGPVPSANTAFPGAGSTGVAGVVA